MKKIRPINSVLVGIITCLMLIPEIQAFAQTGSQWKNLGPFGGNIKGIVTDAQHPGTLLAGTATGEIYKTTNDGQNWFYLNTVGKPIRRLMIDTINGNNLYVFASHETDLSPQAFVSTDGGQTWRSNYSHEDFGMIFDSYIIPQNTTLIYAISREGLFRSFNQGASWAMIRSAGDTSELTALALNPQDPFNNFYIAYINSNDQSVIQSTYGGYNYETKLVLPQDWLVTKLFVAQNAQATVFAVISDGDSTKIIYSQNNGTNWNIALSIEDEINQELGSLHWLTNPDQKTFMINLKSGIYKSNNGGMSWQRLAKNSPGPYDVAYLNRSPADTTKLYGFEEGMPFKYILGPSGTLGEVVIASGLNAWPISKINYCDEQFIIAQFQNDLVFSLNQGLDYELIGGQSSPYGAFYSYASNSFVWIEADGRICYTPNGRDTTCRQAPFTGMVTGGYSENFFIDDTSITIMVVSVGSGPSKGMWLSENDGESWTNITYNSGLNGVDKVVKSISAYPTRVNDQERIRILVATDNSIHAILMGGSTWNNSVFTAPAGTSINEISSNQNKIMISAVDVTGSKLFFSELKNSQWNTYDISVTIQPLYNQNGPGRIIHVNSGIDGNYLILEHYPVNQPTKRKLYKIGYDPDKIRWVEITESPVDVFLFNSIGTNYVFDDYSFNVYAAANNGIWKLEQIPVITHDTLVTAPATEVLTGESELSVMYRNSGSAFGVIDSFFLDDPEGNFSFADSNDIQQGLFLDIKIGTPLDLYFHPRSLGLKEATLTAYLAKPKQNGIDDSSIVLTTKLKGQSTFAQLGTGLKGDSLNMGATMIGTTLTKTFYIKNTGTENLDVYDIYLDDAGTSFDLLMDTTVFSLAPGESKPVTISFDAGASDSLITGECWINSSAYNSQQNQLDTLRKITLTARASWMNWVQSDDPVLNQSYTLNVWLTDMKNSTATATLKYWPTGSQISTLKSRVFTQVPYPDNHLHLNVNIPAEDITEKGLSFYIEVSDGIQIRRFPENGDKSPIRLGVKIPSPGLNSSSWVTLPGGTSRNAFRMVSFPIDLDNKSVQSAFTMSNLGELGDKGDWQLWRWDRTLSRFIKATDISQSFGNIYSGKSYLLITRQAKTLNSGPGKTVVPGSAQTLILPGWNMISNPYTFPISWRNVAEENDGRIDFHNIVILNNGRFEYVNDKNLQLFRLEPWKGYFYYSDTSTFIMKYPANDVTLFSKESSENAVAPRFAIQGELLSVQSDRLGLIEFGEHAEALNGRDIFDKPSLPSLSGDDVQIRLSDPDGKFLHSDFRRNSESGNSWDFEIINLEHDQSLSLMFNGTENLTDGFMLAVLNRKTGKLDYVASGKDIRVRGSGTGTVQFRAFVGTKDYIESQAVNTIPSEFYLAQNYPNPFNPSTTIHYGLPSSSNVELTIYNSLGQKVRTLFSGVQNAGQQRIVWNGRNNNGTPVSSGIYIFRASIRSLEDGGHFRQSRKMMLIK